MPKKDNLSQIPRNKRRREQRAEAVKKQKQLEEAAKKQKQLDWRRLKNAVPRLTELALQAQLPLDANSCTIDHFAANESYAEKLLAWQSLRGNEMKSAQLPELLHTVGLLRNQMDRDSNEKAHTSVPEKATPLLEQQKITAVAKQQQFSSPKKTPAAPKDTPSSSSSLEQQKIPSAVQKQQQFSSPQETPAAVTLPSTFTPNPTAATDTSSSVLDLLAQEDLDALDEDSLAILSNNLQNYGEQSEKDYAEEEEELRKYEAELKGKKEESKKRDEIGQQLCQELEGKKEESKKRDEIGEQLCQISSRRLSRIDERRQGRDARLLLQTKVLTVTAKKKKQTPKQTPERFAELQQQGHGRTNLFDDKAFHGSDLSHGGAESPPVLKESSPNEHTTGRDYGGSGLPHASTQNQSPPRRQGAQENETGPDKPTQHDSDDEDGEQNSDDEDGEHNSDDEDGEHNSDDEDGEHNSDDEDGSSSVNRVRFDVENVQVRFFEKSDENQEKVLVSYKTQHAVKNRWMSKGERKFIRDFSVNGVNKLKEQGAARQVLHVAHHKELLDKLDQGALAAAYEKGYTKRLSDEVKNDRKALLKTVRMKLHREREGIKVSIKKKELMSESEQSH